MEMTHLVTEVSVKKIIISFSKQDEDISQFNMECQDAGCPIDLLQIPLQL